VASSSSTAATILVSELRSEIEGELTDAVEDCVGAPAALKIDDLQKLHRKRVGMAPCRAVNLTCALDLGRTSSITMFSAAALPSAAFSRCSRSATVGFPQTKATRFLPIAGQCSASDRRDFTDGD